MFRHKPRAAELQTKEGPAALLFNNSRDERGQAILSAEVALQPLDALGDGLAETL